MTITRTIRASVSLLAIVLVAAGAAAAAAGTTTPPPTDKTSGPTEIVGAFTGTFANGMPIYRFPPVSVVAHRKVELDKTANVKPGRAKAALRQPT